MAPHREPHKPASEHEDLQPQGYDAITDEPLAKHVVSFSNRQLTRIRDLLGRLYGARRAVRFYPEDHPAVQEAVDGLMHSIAEYHAEGVDIPLTFFEDELLLGEQTLPEDSVLFDQLIRDMTSIGAGSIIFERGLDTAELARALLVLAADEQQVEAAGGLDSLLEGAGLEHILTEAVHVLDDRGEGPQGEDAARAAYGSALDLLRDLEMALRRGHTAHAGSTRTVVRSLVENVLSNRFAMLELSGLKDYDEYTFYHSINVAILALALGAKVTQDRRFLNSLGAGALMHDVGKMTVEGSILNKPGALTPEEWAEMRMHPVHGAELVAMMPGLDKAAVVVVLEHHMRLDGRGYPSARAHHGQHLASRIVSVADAFDAMTSQRSYSAARLPDDAMSVLVENVGTAFDEDLVRLFVTMMGVYPPRSVVVLDSGEVAIVLAPNEGMPTRPLIRVISGPDGTVLEPFDVDLSGIEVTGRAISHAVDPSGLNVDVDDYL
jgi:HD-GYP domain-containing protein (c-di-GMP phosphodiesterase class II)